MPGTTGSPRKSVVTLHKLEEITRTQDSELRTNLSDALWEDGVATVQPKTLVWPFSEGPRLDT